MAFSVSFGSNQINLNRTGNQVSVIYSIYSIHMSIEQKKKKQLNKFNFLNGFDFRAVAVLRWIEWDFIIFNFCPIMVVIFIFSYRGRNGGICGIQVDITIFIFTPIPILRLPNRRLSKRKTNVVQNLWTKWKKATNTEFVHTYHTVMVESRKIHFE